MRARRMLGVVLGVALAAAAAGPAPARGAPPEAPKAAKTPGARPTVDRVRQSLGKLLAELEAMKRTNAKNPDPASRARVEASIERALTRVRAALEGKTRVAMKPRAFAALVRALRKERAEPARLEQLKLQISGQLINAEQAARLVKLFSDQERRIEAAALLWVHLVDPRRTGLLARAVGDAAAQAKLHQRLKFK